MKRNFSKEEIENLDPFEEFLVESFNSINFSIYLSFKDDDEYKV